MSGPVPAIWWAVIVVGATLLAVRRPGIALRAGTALLTGLVLFWLLLCGLGIAVQLQQGGGIREIEVDTPFHDPHRLLGHVVVILAWVSFWSLIPVAMERAIRSGGVLRLLLHLVLASTTLVLVLLSAFSGYLGQSPVTEGSYLRFRILHTVVVPFVGTLSLLGWRVLASRYRVSRNDIAITAVS